MSEIVPIRNGVTPELDVERELIDYFAEQVKGFREEHGIPVSRVAIALLGRDGKKKMVYSRTSSWDTREEASRLELCGAAATLFLQRAMECD